MRFQLVLQWPASSLNDYDEIVNIEDLLIAKLKGQSEVDGHDFGSGEANIFVHTNDPHQVLEEIRAILSAHRQDPREPAPRQNRGCRGESRGSDDGIKLQVDVVGLDLTALIDTWQVVE